MTDQQQHSTATPPSPVVVDYSDLLNPKTDLSLQLDEAFGPSGLGLLTVRNIPGYPELRKRMLPLAAAFAALPDNVKSKYEDEASCFNIGWSCGKEILENGQPDLFKGSFYANPLLDKPSEDAELIRQYPSDLSPNVWPREELPDLDIEFKKLGKLMIDVGLLLVRHCDKSIAAKISSYEGNRLSQALLNSKCHKVRCFLGPSFLFTRKFGLK